MSREWFNPSSLLVVLFVTVLVSAPAAALPQDHLNPEEDPSPQAADAPPGADPHGVLQLAHQAIARQGSLVPGLGPLMDQQHRNLEHTRALFAIQAAEYDSDLQRSVALAQAATRHQSETLGLPWTEPAPLNGYESPSAALLELSQRHDAVPTRAQMEQIQALDGQPEPLRGNLARFVDAFLAFERASQHAYAHADLDAIRALENLQEPEAPLAPHETIRSLGVDPTQLLPTRNQLLDAILELAQTPSTTLQTSDCNIVELLPVFSISLGECDEHYTRDVFLLLDTGGNDRFHNNAGGPGLGTASCTLSSRGVAALVSLGEGTDEYGNPGSPRDCGVNGGGTIGAGFLFDAGGNDRYTAGHSGTNGGGYRGGMGFLLDAGGDDLYPTTGDGTNGGGYSGGTGLLIDVEGNDGYTAGNSGTNGGGYTAGVGLLIDLEGTDSYTGGNSGTNGGSFTAGAGSLVDLAGNDRYTAIGSGTNGGGRTGATGFLFDLDGDDIYSSGSSGTNGGGYLGGAGLLLDLAGDDSYSAGDSATNGGGAAGGIGLLLNHEGVDHYQDPLVGSCWDCTLVPKGIAGAQIDQAGMSYGADVGCTPTLPAPGETTTCQAWLEVDGATVLDHEEEIVVPDPVKDTTGLEPVSIEEDGLWIDPSPYGADTGALSIEIDYGFQSVNILSDGATFSCDEGLHAGETSVQGEGLVPFSATTSGVGEPSDIAKERCRILALFEHLYPVNVPLPSEPDGP